LPVPGGPSRLPVALAVGLLALAVGGFAVARLTTRESARGAASSGPVVPSAASAPSRSFTLVLDSRPPGADVWDGDDVIGTTPMQVTVDRASVKNAQRHFVLRLEGYAPYTLLQGDSEGIVQVTAPLEALLASPSVSASAPPAPGRALPRWTPPRATGTATQHPDMDIKLQR
jgi:serine/threonine-protein kinase